MPVRSSSSAWWFPSPLFGVCQQVLRLLPQQAPVTFWSQLPKWRIWIWSTQIQCPQLHSGFFRQVFPAVYSSMWSNSPSGFEPLTSFHLSVQNTRLQIWWYNPGHCTGHQPSTSTSTRSFTNKLFCWMELTSSWCRIHIKWLKTCTLAVNRGF